MNGMTEMQLWEHLGDFINASVPMFTFIAFMYMIVYIRDQRKLVRIKNRRTGAKD